MLIHLQLFNFVTVYLLGVGMLMFLLRKNYIFLLIALELVTLAVNLQFISASVIMDDFHGQIVSLYLLTTAGVDSSIGLALLLNYYRLRGSISTLFVNLKG